MAFATFDPARSPAPLAEINMVPLIDVMLVLLVIFILTAPLLSPAVPLRLPQADAPPHVPPPRRIDIAIDATGQRWWNGHAVSRAQLQQRLSAAAGNSRTAGTEPPQLQLRADEAAAYREIAQTLADAAAVGLTRIAFLAAAQDAR